MVVNVAVLASGSGTNLQSIIDGMEAGKLDIEIMCVISDKSDAVALERAKKHNIPYFFIDPNEHETREEHELEIVNLLEDNNVELIILAGYMRIITPFLINKYKNKIMNVHPALLPSFPGCHGYEDAFNYGVKVSGCTIHFVDEGTDTGPIILQKANKIKEDDTLESFKERGLKLEHEVFSKAIKLYTEGKLEVVGRKVKIK